MRREARILSSVGEIRSLDPGIGSRKLWLMLRDVYGSDWMPGRDAFFRILRRNKLMQHRPKPRRTTNSNHRYHKWKNLVRGIRLTHANQLWVGDITYIDTDGGCCYLHLVTDAYSKKIVGWCLAPSLSATHTLAALRMAVGQAERKDLSGLIHHSDRGIQYCCDLYVEELQRHGILISMTEDYKPTDNAIAERVNGIIKTEHVYRQEQRFSNLDDALQHIGRFVDFYNNQRPHMSIGMQTPSVAHGQTGEQKKMWKKKNYQKNEQILRTNS